MNMQQTSPEFNIAYLAYENVGHKKSNDRSKGKIVSGPTRPAVPKPKVDVCNKALQVTHLQPVNQIQKELSEDYGTLN